MKEENHKGFQSVSTRDDRLDIVKAISICLVLVWHLRPIQIVLGKTPNNFIRSIDFIVNNLYVNLTLVAVPIFILTSLFLLFQKLQTSGYEYLIKRCRRLLEILIFWSVTQFMIYYLCELIISFKDKTSFSWYIDDFDIYGFLGGIYPFLPVVRDSVFYFILIILELTIISYILFYWQFNKFKFSIGIAIIIVSLVYFEYLNFTNNVLPYWRIDNFLIYIPIAYFLANQQIKITRKRIIMLYICFLLFIIQNIFIENFFHYNTGIYSRISIILGALAVFTTCLNLKDYKAPKTIKFLSRFSLGIFAIHKYWQLISVFFVPYLSKLLSLLTNISMDGLIIDISAMNIAISATLLTFYSVYLLDKSPFKKFIK